MYRTKRLFGWIFQKYYPDRGWYTWQNFIISDAPNQLYGPYKTRKQAFFPSNNPFILQRIEYYLTKPTSNVYYDTRKENSMPDKIQYPAVNKEDVLETIDQFYKDLRVSIYNASVHDRQAYYEHALKVAKIHISQIQHMMQEDLRIYQEAIAKKREEKVK